MSKRVVNSIIVVMLVLFLVFFVGSFAYENYRTRTSDKAYEERLNDLDDKEKENESGLTNEESKNA